MQESEEQQVRRSQRDYSLAFKLAVVDEVARGELSKKQAKHRYGIQGRSTVLVWCRQYATHLATFQQAGRTAPGQSPAVAQTPEQRIKQLQTALRDQKRQYEKQLQNSAELNLLLRTMLQVVEEDHNIPLPKKSFQRPFPVSKPLKK